MGVCCLLVATAALLVLVSGSSPSPEASRSSAGGCCAQLAAVGFHTELPVVVLDSGGKRIPHHVDTPITVCTCNSGAAIEDYSGPAIAAGRGSSSGNFTKKSYKLQLRNSSGGKGFFPFLGMPEDDDWILYGDEVDKTLGLRDFLTYNLARISGRYASRTVWVEVFLVDDGAPLGRQHYNGLYIAEEKVKRAKKRVDIQKMPSAYLFLYDNDNIEAGDTTFGPADGWEHPFLMKEPKNVPDGGAALLRYLNQFQAALEAPDWLQRGGNASYRSYIDLAAFVDFFLLVELSKNPDGYRGSTYMYRDGGGPLVMGPAWDYNEAYGECCGYPIDGWQRQGISGPGVSGGSAISPEGWRFNICDDPGRCLVEPKDGTSRWYRRMWQDPAFRQAASARWQQLRVGPWSDAAVKSLIGDATVRIRPAAVRNYNRYAAVFQVAPGAADAAWGGEVSQVQDWLLKHVAWMDSSLAAPAAAPAGAVEVAASTAGR